MRTPYLPELVSEGAMNRRRFLHAASMAAGSVVAGCYRSRPRAANAVSGINCNLAPVLVSPDREIRTVVGLRPYRHSDSWSRLRSNWSSTTMATEEPGLRCLGVPRNWLLRCFQESPCPPWPYSDAELWDWRRRESGR